MLRHKLEQGTSVVIVADSASKPVGFAEVSDGADIPPFPIVARAAVNAMGLVGALQAGVRSTARRRVEMPAPEGLHLIELQVSPEHRNGGIGAFLLGQVDDYAIQQNAANISLTAATDNPARRLYERNGYRVIATRTNPRYRRITGSEGRVLMVKPVGIV